MITFSIVLGLLAAIIIFLYGIENFSKEVHRLAGGKLRHFLGRSTSNRFSATAVGAVSTALVQSSTATTVITTGLVSAGIISFAQSLGIIFGANIGTTVTAQLVALKMTSYASLFLIIGFLLSLTHSRLRLVGKGLFYFGLVFFGLFLVSQAVEPLKDDPAIISLFSQLSSPLLGVLLGFAFTALVQSSSVTSGLVVILAGSGLVGLPLGISLLLGANIGTTITAMIASFRLNVYARRSAVAHLLFNLGGAMLILLLLTPFTTLVLSLGGSSAQQVATAHTLMNVGTAALFLIFLTPFRKLVEFLVPGKEPQVLLRPKYLERNLPESTTASRELIEKELHHNLQVNQEMLYLSRKLLRQQDRKEVSRLETLESLSDVLDEVIEDSLLKLSHRKMTRPEAERVVLLVRMSNLLEQLGDTLEDLGFLHQNAHDSGIHFSSASKKDLDELLSLVHQALGKVTTTFPREVSRELLLSWQKEISRSLREKYEDHVERLRTDESYSGSYFVEAASLVEHIFDRIVALAWLLKEYNEIKD